MLINHVLLPWLGRAVWQNPPSFPFFLLTELPAQHFNCIVLIYVSVDTLCASQMIYLDLDRELNSTSVRCESRCGREIRDFLRAQARISNVTRKRQHFLYSLSSAAKEGYSIVHGNDIALL